MASRLKIAFFDYPDVFEDFYPHYGVTQLDFALKWHNTGTHAWLKIIQEEIGDVTWNILSVNPSIDEKTHEYTKVKIRFLKSTRLHRFIWKRYYTSRYSRRLSRYFRIFAFISSYSCLFSNRIFKVIKKDKPDLILSQEYCSGKFDILSLFARRLKIPILTYHTGSTPGNYSGKFMKKFTIPKSDWIFTSGKAELERLHNKYKIPHNKLNIIRPPVDISIYKPGDRKNACQVLGLTEEKRYWLFIGRLDNKIKRVSSIINGFNNISDKYKNIDLLIAGSGNDEKKIRHLVNEKGNGRIHMVGWVATDTEKSLLYNCAELIIMASKREGFPSVIGEAFAVGKPVISSDVGTISDLVIPGKTGWLFPAGDENSEPK